MKYLQKYIKGLSNNVVEKTSYENSNSVYYTIDEGFHIRLSDHFSPIVTCSSHGMEIVKLFDRDDFIVSYRDYRTPMLKNRKEVKEFIKFAYDIYRMHKSQKSQSKKLSDGKGDEIPSIDGSKWKSHKKEIEKLSSKYPKTLALASWKRFGTIIGCLPFGAFKKDVKEVLKLYLESKKLNQYEILEVIFNLYENEDLMSINDKSATAYCRYCYELKKKS